MPLGIYISVPFCKTKCSYCNFASGVFSKAVFARYVDRVVADVSRADQIAKEVEGRFETTVDSIYLGGGTPTLLEPAQLERTFAAVREKFRVKPDAEVTVECAPGTLTPDVIATLVRCGVNRVSLGVQSFVDEESKSVARLHTRAIVVEEIGRLAHAGIDNISIDLIAGLPHQTRESWEYSLDQVVELAVPHASVYMLEVDEDSRLGRELIAGGTKYHAHFVPDEDLTADLYQRACDRLNAAGISQYEISNFAREGWQSRHNLKYWKREPYLGFGVDAHSMLLARPQQAKAEMEREIEDYLQHAPHFAGQVQFGDSNFYERMGVESVRFSTVEALEQYMAGAPFVRTPVPYTQALEEAHFLGLRLNRGLNARELAERYGPEAATVFRDQISELRGLGLVEVVDGNIRLTDRGRLLSNEVFGKFISVPTTE